MQPKHAYSIPAGFAALIFGVAVGSFASLVHAELGFDQGTMPAAVERAKASAFLIFAKRDLKFEVGTAFVVRQDVSGQDKILYLVTAQHVLANVCPGQGHCAGVEVSREPKLRFKNSVWQADGKYLKTSIVEVIAANPAIDLALIRIAWRENTEFENLQLAPNCSPSSANLFPIGFPLAYDRWDSTGISDQKALLKRVSRGVLVNPVFYDLHSGQFSFTPIAGAYKLLGLSADSFGGNSGGPIVDETGFVVGVFKSTAAVPANAFHYTGDDAGPDSSPHTTAIPCEDLRDFLAKLNLY